MDPERSKPAGGDGMKDGWRTGQRVDPRGLFYAAGRDFRCDARVLAVRLGERLVWTRPIGGKESGLRSRPPTLEIRTFRFEADGRPVFQCSLQVCAGGWLSKERLQIHRPTIDAHFGEGVTASLDRRTTIYVTGEDPVFDYLMTHRCRSARTLRSAHLRVDAPYLTSADLRVPSRDGSGRAPRVFSPSWLSSTPKAKSR